MIGPILVVRPEHVPKCCECGAVDGLGVLVEDFEFGEVWWLCRACNDGPPPPEMEGQQALDVGDADALEGVLV